MPPAFCFKAQILEDARRLDAAHPMHRSGARRYEPRRLLVNQGALTHAVSLSGEKALN